MDHINFIFFYGCPPRDGVDADTKMISNVVDVLKKGYDRVFFAINIPGCFEDLEGDDASFEVSASNTMQPIQMIYSFKVITYSVAAIFVNTNTRGLVYDGAEERAENYRQTFKEEL